MALKKSAPAKPQINISATLREYAELRSRSKTISDRMKVLAESIKNYAMTSGNKDDKGSFYIEDPDFTSGALAKKTVGFTDGAIQYLKDRKLTSAIASTVVESIDEAKFEELIADNKITTADLAEITETKTTYSVLVNKKEEMATVEEHTVTKKKR